MRMTDWTTKVWGIDASDATTCNFSNALKNGLGFAIHRIGQGVQAIDPQWPNFVQQAYDQKVPVIGGYYVVDPVYYVEKLQGIDKLRISKGIARWTSNFTPPSGAYAPPAAPSFIPRVIMF